MKNRARLVLPAALLVTSSALALGCGEASGTLPDGAAAGCPPEGASCYVSSTTGPDGGVRLRVIEVRPDGTERPYPACDRPEVCAAA